MKTYRNVSRSEWRRLVERPQAAASDVSSAVFAILAEVRSRGDAAVREFSIRFDGGAPTTTRVDISERDARAALVDPGVAEAIERAIENITTFHRSQCGHEPDVETTPGVVCFRRSVPIERVGIYIPGGTAQLFSTLIMLAVPAVVAGCREIVLVTPGRSEGILNPIIARCARALGISEIYLIGGAQAIGALAYGTESIPQVGKICGPGNSFVTEAKLQVAAQGLAIDMPAGPSEVLVIADDGADPRWVAADLLAQAEHGPGSQVVLVGMSEEHIARVAREVARQCELLPRGDFAREAIEGSFALVVSSIDEALEFSNLYAPEHLILSLADPEPCVARVQNAGSVFLGYYAAEALGDYASGTNHVLPTNRAAIAYSGVSVDTFMKKITFQRVSREGLRTLAPTVVTMARAEGLEAHAQAVLVREEVRCD